jgi:hypothetical protein
MIIVLFLLMPWLARAAPPKQQPKAIVADALSGNAAPDPFSRAISDRERSICGALHLRRY